MLQIVFAVLALILFVAGQFSVALGSQSPAAYFVPLGWIITAAALIMAWLAGYNA
jgi:hypothetical protein